MLPAHGDACRPFLFTWPRLEPGPRRPPPSLRVSGRGFDRSKPATMENDVSDRLAGVRAEAACAIAGAASTRRARGGARAVPRAQERRSRWRCASVRDRETGMLLNGIRQRLEAAVEARERDARRRGARPAPARGGRSTSRSPARSCRSASLHPITQVRRAVEDAFLGLGYEVRDDREVETVEYNFDKLAFVPTHSARSPRDTFFFDDDHVLRTETSPSQIHMLEEKPPPIYMVSIGRVYRRDAITATRYPIFHQFEGLAVDEGLTLADLQGDAAARDARALRARAARPLPHALLPVHRAVDRAGRLVRDLRRRGLPHLQVLGLDRDGRRRHGRPARASRTSASTPRSGAGSRSAAGSSAPRSCATTSPTSARSGKATCAC